MLEEITKLFDELINTELRGHGGGAEPLRVEDDTLFVRMYGSCVGCLQIDETVTGFILETVQARFPVIKKIELEDPVEEEMYAFAKTLMGQHKA